MRRSRVKLGCPRLPRRGRRSICDTCFKLGMCIALRDVAAALMPRGHELPIYIVTFDGLTLPYGFLGL